MLGDHQIGAASSLDEDVVAQLAQLQKLTGQELLQAAVDASRHLLSADVVVYHRHNAATNHLDLVCSSGTPPNFPLRDYAVGHICYEETLQARSSVVALEDVERTVYQRIDPYVQRYGIKAYLGVPVHFRGRPVGSLAAVYGSQRSFDARDIAVLLVLGSVLETEETSAQMLKLGAARDALVRALVRMQQCARNRDRPDEMIGAIFGAIQKEAAFGAVTILIVETAHWPGIIESTHGYTLPTDCSTHSTIAERLPCVQSLQREQSDAVRIQNRPDACVPCPLRNRSPENPGLVYAIRAHNRTCGYIVLNLPTELFESSEIDAYLRMLAHDIAQYLYTIERANEIVLKEQELSFLSMLHDATLHNSADAILLVNRKGELLELNARAEQLLWPYFSLADLLPELVGTINEDSPRAVQDQAQSNSTPNGHQAVQHDHREPIRQRISLTGASGKTILADVVTTQFSVMGVDYFAIQIRDCTAQVEMERALIQSERIAVMQSLSAGIAHDVRNILGVIQLQNDLLEDLATSNPERLKDIQENIHDAVQACTKLVARLASSGRNPESTITGDLSDLVAADVRLLQKGVTDVNIHFTRSNAPLPIRVSGTALIVILSNLILNGAYACRKKHPYGTYGRIDVCTALDADPEGNGSSFAKLQVKDDGIGIGTDAVASLFELGYSTKGSEGCGLGLFNVKKTVEENGATIDVESIEGESTCFTIRFPLQESACSVTPQHSPERSAP